MVAAVGGGQRGGQGSGGLVPGKVQSRPVIGQAHIGLGNRAVHVVRHGGGELSAADGQADGGGNGVADILIGGGELVQPDGPGRAARAAAIDHVQAGEGGRALGQLGADVLPSGEVQGGQQELPALEAGVRRRGHQGIARAVAVHPHAQPALSGRDGQRAVQARRSACGGVIGHPQALAAVVDVVQAGLGPVGGRAGGTEGGQVALTVLQRLDVARDTHRHGECLAPGGDGEVTAGALCPGGKDAVCVHRAHLWVR